MNIPWIVYCSDILLEDHVAWPGFINWAHYVSESGCCPNWRPGETTITDYQTTTQ